MFLFQPFFFLFLLSTSLIPFSASPVIRPNADLRSLVFRRLTLATLLQFPKGYVTKEDFRVCLENWLSDLKEWNKDEIANVEGANYMAQELGLTGDKQKIYLQLSDPPDNTQPAPWAYGLSLVLLQANWQLTRSDELTLLMPWIFIPDGQAFHFTMVYQKAVRKTHLSGLLYRYPDSLYSEVFKQLVPKLNHDFLNDKWISLDAVYVWHNRNGNLKRKSQVNDLKEYEKCDGGLSRIWRNLMDYPWLMDYVKFGKTALGQLLAEYETQLMQAQNLNLVEKVNVVIIWIKKELKEGGK